MDTDAPAAFDEGEFLDRVGGDCELAADVARLFLDDCPRRLAAIRDALGRGDASASRAEAHGLKGAAANMSAHRLSSLARDVEEHALAGRFDRALMLMEEVAAQAAAVLAAVREFELAAAAR